MSQKTQPKKNVQSDSKIGKSICDQITLFLIFNKKFIKKI